MIYTNIIIYKKNSYLVHNEEESIQLSLRTLKNIGDWPLLLGDKWNETEFDLTNTIFKIIEQGFPMTFPVLMTVGEDYPAGKILQVSQQLLQLKFIYPILNHRKITLP